MKYLIVILLLSACSGKGSNEHAVEENEVKEAVVAQEVTIKKVQTQQLKDLMAKESELQLVDVRTAAEVQEGTIDGAITDMDFTTGEFKANLARLDKDKPVAVYCARGGRSAKAAEMLKAEGFRVVYDYTEGYAGWSQD